MSKFSVYSLIKKEYYGQLIIFDVSDIITMEYDEGISVASISFNNGHIINFARNSKDIENDHRRIVLDIYSVWRKYLDNTAMTESIRQQMEMEE